MPKIILVSGLIFFLFTVTNAQTVKTEPARRLAVVESEINSIQSQIENVSKVLERSKVRYTEQHPDVRAAEAVLAELHVSLLKLETERKKLNIKELVRSLPKTDVELLKVIVLQNERILDLLEQLALKSEVRRGAKYADSQFLCPTRTTISP
jgi:hypothetical protein